MTRCSINAWEMNKCKDVKSHFSCKTDTKARAWDVLGSEAREASIS